MAIVISLSLSLSLTLSLSLSLVSLLREFSAEHSVTLSEKTLSENEHTTIERLTERRIRREKKDCLAYLVSMCVYGETPAT